MKKNTFMVGNIVKSLNPIYGYPKYLIGIIVDESDDNEKRLMKFYDVKWFHDGSIETVLGHEISHL